MLPEVQTVGREPNKKGWMRLAHPTLNVSFVLSGGGEFRMSGRAWTVTAPSVVIQWANIHVSYGPTAPWKAWDELYAAYLPHSALPFKRAGLLDMDRPVWSIEDMEQFTRHRKELDSLLRSPMLASRAEQVDQCVVSMLMDSARARAAQPAHSVDARVLQVRDHVDRNYTGPIELESCAQQSGLPPTTFRRHWKRLIHCPLATYVSNLRLQESRRLLVESSSTIGQIAASVGYSDPLYFSRLFKRSFGMGPREYRSLHGRRGSVQP